MSTTTNAGRRPTLRTVLGSIGPALVLATVVIGPGSLTLHTLAGSGYGYRLLWVPVLGTAAMTLYTWLSARITLVTGRTLLDVAGHRYGARVAKIGALSAYLAVISFQAGNSVAVGFAANALFGGDVRLWALFFCVTAALLILLQNLYRKIELLVRIVVGLMLLTFVGTAAMVGFDAGDALAGLVPAFPDPAAVYLTLGMVATTFSIVAAAYQGYLMREKNWGPEHLGMESVDSLVGIAVLGVISIVVLLTSAGALYGGGAEIRSAQDMARQLEPLAGPGAFYLFTLGFFFASYSSLVVNPLIGATLLVDGFGGRARMDDRQVKRWTMVALAVGLAVVLVFQGTPVELLRAAQAFAVVALPVLGLLVVLISRSRAVMGEHASGPVAHVAAILGYLALLGIVANYLRLIAAEF